MLKVTHNSVPWEPYLLTLRLPGPVFVYIMLEANRDLALPERCSAAVRHLRALHQRQGRTHGDVNPSNLYDAGTMTRGFNHEDLLDPVRQLARKNLGWEDVWLRGFSYGLFVLIDPDISCRIGARKPVSNVHHEDPRTVVADPMDDLIGLLNAMLLETGVSVQRIGGFAYDSTCDFIYDCNQAYADHFWRWICWSYAEPEYLELPDVFFDYLRKGAPGSGFSSMSAVLRSCSIRDKPSDETVRRSAEERRFAGMPHELIPTLKKIPGFDNSHRTYSWPT
eukprot:TRINITY_DN1498_c0_g1_i1.p3 TRINITY_DN1498_c0_g1~~TRINITY_DN1498_c0_g1_i1.p3  ORF type:complete len:279 (-),score=39.80 TRINITY_DN1498_c0_g1_i1:384-1220(-)